MTIDITLKSPHLLPVWLCFFKEAILHANYLRFLSLIIFVFRYFWNFRQNTAADSFLIRVEIDSRMTFLFANTLEFLVFIDFVLLYAMFLTFLFKFLSLYRLFLSLLM